MQPDTVWRNRDSFIEGREEVVQFLTKKWEKENGYRLRKELFAFMDNKIAVQVRHCLFRTRAWYLKVLTRLSRY